MTSHGPQESSASIGGLQVRELPGLLLADSEFVPVCLAVFAAFVFLFLLEYGLALSYHPNLGELLRVAKEVVTPAAAAALKPEPVERLQYLLGLVFTPSFLLLALPRLRAFYWRATNKARRILNCAVALLLAEGTVAVPIYAYQSLKRSDFLYVRSSIVYSDFALYVLLVFPALVGMAFLADRRWVALVARWAIRLVSAYLTIVVFLVALFNCDSAVPWGHLDPVLYPLAQVHAGKTLLVDCAPLYGLYPHFLQPVFKLVSLTVFHFTTVMALLLVVSLWAQWLFLRSLTKNNVVLLCGIVAAPFFAHLTHKIVLGNDPYFQYWPIRVLFPSLLILLASLYLRGRAKRLVYYCTFLCVSAAILWNPDTGSVVFGSWILLLCYCELFRNSWRSALRPLLGHALTASASLLLTLGSHAIFARLRSGTWPNWRMSSSYYELFSHYGYYMLPMGDLPHTWGLIVGIYVLAFAVAVRGMLHKRDEPFYGSLFLLTILGSGLFGYYNGRSHDNCIIFLLYVPSLIATLLVDRVFTSAKGNPAYFRLLPLACLLFFFPASALPSLFLPTNVIRFKEMSFAGIEASKSREDGQISLNVAFVKGLTKPGESIFILVKGFLEGPYYAESSTRSALDLPSSIDWFFKRDYAQIEKFLRENKSVKLFAIPGQFPEYTGLLKAYRAVASQTKTGLTMYLPNRAI
jgi:hypothetical protein